MRTLVEFDREVEDEDGTRHRRFVYEDGNGTRTVERRPLPAFAWQRPQSEARYDMMTSIVLGVY